MAKKKQQPKNIESFSYDEASRTNIPIAEYQPIMEKKPEAPVRVAYERRSFSHPKYKIHNLHRAKKEINFNGY